MHHDGADDVVVARLVERLVEQFEHVELGHCVRVEPLRGDVASVAAQQLRGCEVPNLEAWVLGHQAGDLTLTTDRAIEIRNRKGSNLCLFVPAELQDAALSSLGNSFAVFDVARFLDELCSELRADLPPDLQDYVRTVSARLRGRARPPAESEISYYAGLLSDPSAERAGRDLWKLGLVPDLTGAGDPQYDVRLERNRRCMDCLVRPSRMQASLDERIDALGLEPGHVRDTLRTFLQGRRLQTDTGWLREIAEAPNLSLTFENWRFPEIEPTDLDTLDAEPFLDDEMRVKPFCKLRQEAPGTQLLARCGPKQFVVVKWHTKPNKPANVAHWRVELQPCPDEYNLDEIGTIELPAVTVRSGVRSAKIPLDLEPEELPVRRVNAVITPLDANGFEIRRASEDEPVRAVTLDFWLEGVSVGDEDGGGARKVGTVRSLPDAYLRVAWSSPVQERKAQPLPCEEKNLLYYPTLVGDRQVHRIAVSKFMRDLQVETIAHPDTGGRYAAVVDGVAPLEMEDIQPDPVLVGEPLAEAWDGFIKARTKFFGALRADDERGLIETADPNKVFVERAKAYARAYLALLRRAHDALTAEPARESRAHIDGLSVARVDTLHVERRSANGPAHAILVLPTHPLRAYWYACYAELLRYFESQLYGIERSKDRKRHLSLESVRRLSARNFPAFVPAGGGRLYVYASDVQFFTGVALAPETADPTALVQDMSRLAGYDAEAVGADIDATRLADEVERYLLIHPYADALRLNIVNPGDGTLVRDVVLRLLRPSDDGEPERPELQSVDVITHAEASTLQFPAPGLDALVEAVRHDLRRGRSHLHPLAQIARRPTDALPELPGHDTHLAFCLDHFRPAVVACPPVVGEESASAYGLVARFQGRFEVGDAEATWFRQVVYGQPPQIERHPQDHSAARDLVALHQAYLALAARLLDPNCAPTALPCLRLDVHPSSTRLLATLHDRADWVITVDRHFGAEYYDDPSSPHTARNAERYLLDYVPEFMEGMGHRVIVTTQWPREIAEILARGLEEMALSSDPGSCKRVLDALKAVSGRLALRLVGDTPQEREAISLAIVVEHLRHEGELEEAFLVPVDAHCELLDFGGLTRQSGGLPRCDLMLVRPGASLRVSFIEVKYRSGDLSPGVAEDLYDRIADQTRRTEAQFRETFGCAEDGLVPLDQAIRRSHLSQVFRFYLDRACRHGLLSREAHERLRSSIQKIEVGMPRLVTQRVGYVVSPTSPVTRKIRHQGTMIHVIGGPDIASSSGLSALDADLSPDADAPAGTDVIREHEQAGGTRTTGVPKAPSSGDDEVRVVLGETIGTGEPCVWTPSVKGSPHLFIIGIPGQGKSVTVQRVLQSLVLQGIPTLALDFHGELAAKAPGLLAKQPYRIIDATRGLPFSPFEAVGDSAQAAAKWQANAFSVAEIVGWVCDLGDIQQDLVYEAIRNCYQAGLADAASDGLPTPADVFAEIERLSETRRVRNVVPRVRPLFDVDFELFRPVPGESLYDSVPGLGVFDLHGLGQEALQLGAGAFILRKVYKDMLQWPAADRPKLVLVLDEAHRLARDLTLPKLMKEGRKFGVVIVSASQGLADFHPDVLANAGAKVVFRMNHPESRRVAGLVRGASSEQEMIRRIEGLPVGRAIVATADLPVGTECTMYQPE